MPFRVGSIEVEYKMVERTIRNCNSCPYLVTSGLEDEPSYRCSFGGEVSLSSSNRCINYGGIEKIESKSPVLSLVINNRNPASRIGRVPPRLELVGSNHSLPQ